MYDFDAGLAQMERLEVLIASPLLRLLAPTLPPIGMSTKPSAAEPAVLIAVGAATLIHGSDRAADRELRTHWSRFREACVAAGYRVGGEPLSSQHFRDYRDRILGGSLPQEWKRSARELFGGLALEIGLFPESDNAWNRPDLDGIVSADGTWFKAASEVRDMETSRSKAHAPRILSDTDQGNKEGWGYMFCIVSVRGQGRRQRVVLDIAHAPRSAELDVVIPGVLRLRELLGDRFRCFVYDGAMHGVHHRQLRAAGVVSVNKPKGVRSLDQWRQFLGSNVGSGARIIEPPTSCGRRHLLTLTAGVFWELQANALTGYVRSRVLEVAELRRIQSDVGTFSWQMDLVIRCGEGDHTFTVDPNAEIPCATGGALLKSGHGPLKHRSTLNLSDKLRTVQVNEDTFAAVYGRRNDSESGNKNLKSDFGLRHRARSYTVERHDTDMWIYALLANSLAWKEHAQLMGRAARRRAA